MAFPLSVPVILSAVKALIRFRGQLDTILSLSEASKGLPFRLPDAAPSGSQILELRRDMMVFFESDGGRVALALQNMTESFDAVRRAGIDSAPTAAVSDCLRLYLEAAEIPITRVGPQDRPDELRRRASSGPSSDMRLAYYVVESQRLSRNPAVARVLLATADTLLEFAGENAAFFVSNPRTRGVVETLLTEFTSGDDLTDSSAELIFRRLLGATAVAVLAHPEIVPQKPAITALFRALSELKGEQGGQELVARLLTLDGFEDLVGKFVTNVAADPAFLVEGIDGEELRELAKDALAATLREVGKNVRGLLDDPRALLGALEAGLGAAAGNVDGVLRKSLAGQPLLAAVLAGVARSVGAQAQQSVLFRNLAAGEGFARLYSVALNAVAENPAALQGQGLDAFLAGLVGRLAATLANTPLADTLSATTFRQLASDSLAQLAQHPGVVARDDRFAAAVLAGVFGAAAPLVAKGLAARDVAVILDSALRAAAGNLVLADLGSDRLVAILAALGGSLAESGVASLVGGAGARDALLAAISAVNANPAVWGALADKGALKPALDVVIGSLRADPARAADPRRFFAGPEFARALGILLSGLARRGRELVAGSATPDGLARALDAALARAEAELGRTLDGESLAPFFGRVLTEALTAGIGDNADAPQVAAVVDRALAWIKER